MRRFFRSKNKKPSDAPQAEASAALTEAQDTTTPTEPETTASTDQANTATQPTLETPRPKRSWFARLSEGLKRTRHQFTDGLASLLLGRKHIDDDLLEAIETLMLTADMGVDVTEHVIEALTQKIARHKLKDGPAVYQALQATLHQLLEPVSQPLDMTNPAQSPFVILMVGVNGNGKTTTIGKLAKQFQQQGKRVMLAAGDTFRAAAVEQLQAWGTRNQVPVIAQQTGADSAAVIYDAYTAAKARNMDILIADTAGRLHTQTNLMDELKKVIRVLKKIDDAAPHEVMLVLDAGTGQNALQQAEQFQQAVAVSGITLTKLDGTAKGGSVFAIAKRTQLPIRYIGVGEGIDDLKPFAADDFIQGLFDSQSVE